MLNFNQIIMGKFLDDFVKGYVGEKNITKKGTVNKKTKAGKDFNNSVLGSFINAYNQASGRKKK